jgi:hypothetical protein
MINKKKFDMFIVGAHKAGTTSLREYLVQHPAIISHHTDEVPFFAFDREYRMGFDAMWKAYFLPVSKPDGWCILAKNVNVLYSENALKRLHEHNPNVHIGIMLRNPADRAYSAYWFARRKGQELQEPKEAIMSSVSSKDLSTLEKFNMAYLELGKYINYLRSVHKIFPTSQIHVYTVEELKASAEKICNELFGLLGLPPFRVESNFRANEASKPRYPTLARLFFTENITKTLGRLIPYAPRVWLRKNIKIKIARWNELAFKYPPIDMELKHWLVNFYMPYNKELEEFTGRDLNIWNK